eukprot:g6219.t1 g6219   contig22:16423-17748(-)
MNLSPASSLLSLGTSLSSGSFSSGSSSTGSSSSGSSSSGASISCVSSLALSSSVSSRFGGVDDDSSMSSSSTKSSDSDDTIDRFMASQLSIDGTGDSDVEPDIPPKRKRNSNKFSYKFGDFLDCNYYRKFLCQDIRDVIYEKSQDKKSVFRSHFRVPLTTIDDLTEMHIRNGWVRYTGRVRTNFQLSIRTQLFIVHVKWSNCPAGDYNKCKGKESFPSVAFECVTNNRRRVLGIAPIQFGARSDKHIVRFDPTVDLIKKQWYKDVEWDYYTTDGEVKKEKGIYFICDGGYLRWKSLICPYAGSEVIGQRGYFNTNLESIRKDVECTFGILKKRWRILEYGLHYHDMKKCEMVFTVCCVMHNILLDVGEDQGFVYVNPVGRGGPIGRDGLFLEGPVELQQRVGRDAMTLRGMKAADRADAPRWMARRDLLAAHLEYCKRSNP